MRLGESGRRNCRAAVHDLLDARGQEKPHPCLVRLRNDDGLVVDVRTAERIDERTRAALDVTKCLSAQVGRIYQVDDVKLQSRRHRAQVAQSLPERW